MGQTEKRKMIVEIDGRRIEVAGTPGPESVGGEELKDGGIQWKDLSPALRAMIETGGGSAADIIVPVTDLVTAFAPEPGRYYRLDAQVNTLAITLPEMESDTTLQHIGLFLSTGPQPDVTVQTSDGTPVFYGEDYHIEPNKSYELSARWNGLKWVVSMMMFVGWFLFVSPKDVQWVTPDNPVVHHVSSNASWVIRLATSNAGESPAQ